MPQHRDDDDEWIDLGPVSKAKTEKATVDVRMSQWGTSGKARLALYLRHELVAWIEANGPRFKAQLGGADLDRIRIVPDAANGRFEPSNFKGVYRLMLGHVAALPNEVREVEPCGFAIASDGRSLLVTLPARYGSARSGAVAPQAVTKPVLKVEKPEVTQAIPIRTAAPGLSAQARVIDRRPGRESHSFGDPPPGRSALDQRRA